jgi:hypothetical protein
MRGGESDQPFNNGFAHGFDLRLHMQLVIAVFDLGANGFEADTNSATSLLILADVLSVQMNFLPALLLN